MLSGLKRLILLIATVRYLTVRQIYFRLIRKIRIPNASENWDGVRPARFQKWIHIHLHDDVRIDESLNACFLNDSKKLKLPYDWNNKAHSKLWSYNLHYFEDLLSSEASKNNHFYLKLLDCWIDHNPIGHGVGWESYPMSLRIVNILKAWLGGLEVEPKIFDSVYLQASFLSNNLERHLLANHYLVNLKALLFAGVVFKNHRWIALAEKELAVQFSEQILDDGSHFELSPMYHSLILVDMLDMYNLCKADKNAVSADLLLEEKIEGMLSFLETMSHPDGEVAFFNDSAIGIAPDKARIIEYAKRLGFEFLPIDANRNRFIDSVYSGYFSATLNASKLIFDASPIGPDYNPAHAHADSLSFELSVGNERLFVNSGISEYGTSNTRHHQRKTRSHNTVEIDGRDSSEVWDGFRVAKRAKIIDRFGGVNGTNSLCMTAAHTGYKTIFGGCIHRRKIIFSFNELVITDSLEGSFNHAIARFHFHPSLDVCLDHETLVVKGERFSMVSNLMGLGAKISGAAWHPEFGLSYKNRVLEVNYRSKINEIRFSWTKQKTEEFVYRQSY